MMMKIFLIIVLINLGLIPFVAAFLSNKVGQISTLQRQLSTYEPKHGVYMRISRGRSRNPNAGQPLAIEDYLRRKNVFNACKVHVSNFPYTTTEEELREWCSQAGEVFAVKIIKNQWTKKSQGYGYVEYTISPYATAAINFLNETQLGGRTVYIAEAEEHLKPEKPKRSWKAKNAAAKEAKAARQAAEAQKQQAAAAQAVEDLVEELPAQDGEEQVEGAAQKQEVVVA
uniref:RRM domain-containing protein n=1 Tax=Fibrocapsa japonica TaxID=94617 RepID=A0A7S2V4S3_9STRA|eukprot:CAMPEP_0113934504 /NCGR_PEP_ID=MMETSP1339-20121228/1831_1 /TAXON_ID=94617 /ORGANISM="Fibrocapsa japonica" /LENGTH=227 /DNA_ID=CAMNT_0000936345 /DNA_START=72 /DNA_END=755 /DNA_ORIENTATION=- /assembly_acc=CAM_ASM_000762